MYTQVYSHGIQSKLWSRKCTCRQNTQMLAVKISTQFSSKHTNTVRANSQSCFAFSWIRREKIMCLTYNTWSLIRCVCHSNKYYTKTIMRKIWLLKRRFFCIFKALYVIKHRRKNIQKEDSINEVQGMCWFVCSLIQ